MATQVTQFYFLQDPPTGPGNDWEVIILGPNGGNAEISFDNGATWLQANMGYDPIYGGYRYRPPCWGNLSCVDPRQPNWLLLGRMVGETDSLKALIGTYRDDPSDDVYEFAFSAVCQAGNISLNFISQYSQNGPDNYQLYLAKTQTLRLSINGTPLGIKTQSTDGCAIATCHYSQVYDNITVPVSSFPLTAVFSDSGGVLRVSTQSISLIDFGDPCVVAPNPTADAVDDNVGTQSTGVATTVNVGTNDTACDIGTTTWQLISGSESNVTGVSLASGSTFNYTPTANGPFSFQYQILCDGVVLDTATVSGTAATACINVSGGSISGPTPVIPNANYVYTVTGLSGDAPFTYLWSGGTVVSGQGTDTATITIASATTVSVTITNCAGAGSVTLNFPVAVLAATADAVDDNVGTQTVGVPQTVDVSINDTLCSFGTTTFALVSGSEVNTTASLASGSTFNYTPAAVGPFSFQYNILCDGVITDTATVSGTAAAGCTPLTTVTITGPSNVNVGVPATFNATAVDGSGPYVYTWSITNGTINSGQGTASIQAQFTAIGTISITVTNCGGTGTANDTLGVSIITADAVDDNAGTQTVGTPQTIDVAVNDTLCSDGVTTFALVPGSEVNTTASLASGSTFNYTPTAAGPFSFQYNILCDGVVLDTATVGGTATAGCVNTTVTTIAGNTPVVSGVTETYTATPNGSAPFTYNWTVTGGGTILSGQGTSSITASFTSGGSVNVAVTNCAGAGTSNGTLPITLITANAVDDSVTTSLNTTVTIQMAANDTLCN